jgi:hypothetical protein
MTMSIIFARFIFGAATLSAIISMSASAQVVGGSNCSKIRDMTKGSVGQTQCLTRATDNIQDKEGDLRRDGVKTTTWSASQTGSNGHSYQFNRYSDGSGDVRDTNPRTGATSYTVSSPTGVISTFRVTPGAGGSGGKHSAN